MQFSLNQNIFFKVFSSLSHTDIYVKNRFWTGGFFLDTIDKWFWLNGSEIVYTNWFSGEPSHYYLNFKESYIEYRFQNGEYKWNDLNEEFDENVPICKIN